MMIRRESKFDANSMRPTGLAYERIEEKGVKVSVGAQGTPDS
jgi:hypothetical protein